MYPSRDITFISALMNSFVLYVKRSIQVIIMVIMQAKIDEMCRCCQKWFLQYAIHNGIDLTQILISRLLPRLSPHISLVAVQ